MQRDRRATADFTKECRGLGDSNLAEKFCPPLGKRDGTGIVAIGLRRAANWVMAARARLFDAVDQLLLSTQRPRFTQHVVNGVQTVQSQSAWSALSF